ncbi:GNAT family N-acetyltransferase [Pelagovum pacificum]|uniref:GNAT family N-acetyltransferase n=1 Tax=Pelagovum pacificum TaxID=2588711 RepID=A0A5C5G7J5_9RHOB|nr:GNAT family N-acetyltransferase [Pelagovum pacificum]QQA41823.1 GNAT family N-acetyltransferase [Pelagovum pacificum]TNY30733.1 GNAT family N-acetyltransferase [Pelagovum pacificum]
MTETRHDIRVRRASPADLAELDALFGRTYPALLKEDYPPSVLVTAIPVMARAQPSLLSSPTYFIAERQGSIVGAGGWSARSGQVSRVRHVVADHRLARQGIGRAIFGTIFATARAAGHHRMNCEATRTAVPFYRALGFGEEAEATIQLAPGIDFPIIRMARDL